MSMSANDPLPTRLSTSEAVELGTTLSQLVQSGLPLDSGFRAAAREFPGKRLSRALTDMADRLQAGESLGAVIEAQGPCFPAHVRSLVLSGIQAAELGPVLEEIVELQRQTAAVRRQVWLSLAYPLVLLSILFVLFVFVTTAVVPGLAELYQGFDVQLPGRTKFLISLSGGGIWILVANMAVLALGWLVIWGFSATPGVRRMLNHVWLLGTIARYVALAEFARLLALLLERDVPLPEALKLAGSGSRDADLAYACDAAAGQVSAGYSLDASVASLPQFPESMAPVIEWGQRVPALPDALRTVAEIFDGRVQAQLGLLRALVPPFTFLIVLGTALFLVSAGILPIVTLIRALA